jgi:hypothetical protein
VAVSGHGLAVQSTGKISNDMNRRKAVAEENKWRVYVLRLILNHCRFKLAKSVLASRRPIVFFWDNVASTN